MGEDKGSQTIGINIVSQSALCHEVGNPGSEQVRLCLGDALKLVEGWGQIGTMLGGYLAKSLIEGNEGIPVKPEFATGHEGQALATALGGLLGGQPYLDW
jgi:hypothetical protein